MHTGMNRRDILLLSVGLALLGGCDEVLPPRDALLLTLRGDFVMANTAVVVHGGETTGGDLMSSVVNAYDDVLEDTGFIQVDYTVIMEQMPESTATLRATRGDVLSVSAMSGQLVILRPGEPFRVLKVWNHATKNGTPFWLLTSLHKHTIDDGKVYYDSDPVPFVVTCSIRTFKRLPPILLGPARIVVSYRVFDYSPPS